MEELFKLIVGLILSSHSLLYLKIHVYQVLPFDPYIVRNINLNSPVYWSDHIDIPQLVVEDSWLAEVVDAGDKVEWEQHTSQGHVGLDHAVWFQQGWDITLKLYVNLILIILATLRELAQIQQARLLPFTSLTEHLSNLICHLAPIHWLSTEIVFVLVGPDNSIMFYWGHYSNIARKNLFTVYP